jgi:2-hydroxychromene-2-carboxylate isomerase
VRDIDFYYGLGSRYSYLAFTRIDGIETRHGCRFILRPISSVELMAILGRTPFAGPPVSGQYQWDYRQRDAEDWADYYGVPFIEPAGLPEDHRLMARACRSAGRQGAVRRYSGALFRAVFAERVRVDRAACARIAGELGLLPERFAADMDDPDLDAALTADTRDAAARGVFGVPTFFLGERMVWGNDRLVLLEHFLSRPA